MHYELAALVLQQESKASLKSPTSIVLSARLPLQPSVCLSVRLSVCPSVCLSVCPSVDGANWWWNTRTAKAAIYARRLTTTLGSTTCFTYRKRHLVLKTCLLYTSPSPRD